MSATPIVRQIVFVSPPVVQLAAARGLFERHGVRIETTVNRWSIEQMRSLVQRNSDVAFTLMDNIVAWDRDANADLVMLCQAEQMLRPRLFVRPEIRAIADLRGARAAVDSVSTGLAPVLRKILRLQGVVDGDCELVPIGGTAQRYEALLRGDVAATLLTSPFDERATPDGLRELARADARPGHSSMVLAATRRWVADNGEPLRRYLWALLDAARWARAEPNAAEASLRATGLSSTEAAKAIRLIVPDLAFSLTGVRSVIELRAELGLLAPPLPEPADHIDERPLREAWEAHD